MAIKSKINDAKLNNNFIKKTVAIKNSVSILKEHRGKQGIETRREKEANEEKVH